MSEEIKRIDIKEFRKKGYLQELNRQFLHPLGLALEVIIDEETGEETLGGIWDYRKDDGGIWFGSLSGERFEDFKKKAAFVQEDFNNKLLSRHEILGFIIQPVIEAEEEE
ncbi:MAG: hypothetical protein ACW99F_07230 [Candidatus Hodarchaeales archaeon]|jgi:hypothetical protein